MARSFRIPAVLLAGLAALAGCSDVVNVNPATNAADPACAKVMIQLPQDLGGNALRDTTSQATAAWGDPTVAVLRCGLKPPGPTTTPCVSVNDVDWLSEDEGDHWRFTSYGRTPAVEVLISTTDTSGQSVLNSVTPAVANLPKTGACVGTQDADPAP
ncbi:DUF3515 family protein [Saxibacter everestensis]|uniref:DUF3515 family protein n=1 Tax=Saxibacter everestensis TaxID=2909229 RepID=A0ABY8QX94_9MICO|nr:DUF3515 family protein [Brevibacteriaceae bacterium ZFBP1038]